MVCTSIHFCNIKLTFNGPVKYVLPLKIGYFLFLLSFGCISIQYTLVHSRKWSIFGLKKFSCLFLMTESAHQVLIDYFQFLFLSYTNVYETSLWWRRYLKRCVHLDHLMSSSFTVKWVWIYFLRAFKSCVSMVLLTQVLIISVLIHRFNSRCSSSLSYDLRRLPWATPNKHALPRFPKPKHRL